MSRILIATFLLLSSLPQAQAYTHEALRGVQDQTEQEVEDIRNEEILELRKTLGRRSAKERRPEIYLRLTELYIEAYRAAFLLEGRYFEKLLESQLPAQTLNRDYSKAILRKAIQTCEEIIKHDIRYAKIDHVFFFLGYNYGELGNETKSLEYYMVVAQKFPNSPYVGEAYREVGDALFRRLKYREAIEYYQKSAEKISDELKPRVLHRLAWCYFRIKQYQRASEVLQQAIQRTESSQEKFLGLREEALRDMALFLTEGGNVEGALKYFEKHARGSEYYYQLLERLGAQYERNVQWQKANQVYETILSSDASDNVKFRAKARQVLIAIKREQLQSAFQTLLALAPPDNEDQNTQTVRLKLRETIRNIAIREHEAFRKKGTQFSLQAAEAFYYAYINLFLKKESSSPELNEIRMYFGEVKRELGKPKEAARLYAQVFKSDDKRYKKEAAVSWIASVSETITTAPGGAISDSEKEYVEAVDELASEFPDIAESREARLKAAQVLAGYRQSYSGAIDRCDELIADHPTSPQAPIAAQLKIQLLNDRATREAQDPDAQDDLRDSIISLSQNAKLLAADQRFNEGKLVKILGDEKVRVRLTEIASQEKKRQFSDAAKNYEAIGTESNSQETAEKAYSNALSSYLKGKEDKEVLRLASQWGKRFPKSARWVNEARSAATVLFVRGKFKEAAEVFEDLGKKNQDAGSLQTAAVVWNGLSDSKYYRDALKEEAKLGKDKDGKILLNLGESYAGEGNLTEAVTAFSRCSRMECQIKLAETYERQGKNSEAKRVYTQVSKARVVGPDKNFVAQARFRLAVWQEDAARFEPLRFPEARLQKALRTRLEFMEPLSKSYLSVVDLGGSWSVSALHRLALFAWNFAQEISAIQPPSDLEPGKLAQFKRELASISDPLKKRALQTWKDAFEKSVRDETLSPVLPEISDRLSVAKAYQLYPAQAKRPEWQLAWVDHSQKDWSVEQVRTELEKDLKRGDLWVLYGNTLYAQNRFRLAQIAYSRATAVDPKLSDVAQHNLALVELSLSGSENWKTVLEMNAVLSKNTLPTAAFNRASLLAYYRLFTRATPIVSNTGFTGKVEGQRLDLLALSAHATGQWKNSVQYFDEATQTGLSPTRFHTVFHEVSRMVFGAGSNADRRKCVDRTRTLFEIGLKGFEEEAAQRLKQVCLLVAGSS